MTERNFCTLLQQHLCCCFFKSNVSSKQSESITTHLPSHTSPHPSSGRFDDRSSIRSSTYKTPLLPLQSPHWDPSPVNQNSHDSKATSLDETHQSSLIGWGYDSKTSTLTLPQRYITLFNHQSTANDILSFNKGETILVIDKSAGNWWLAHLLSTQQKGYIPSNYVQLAPPDTINAQIWYFGKAGRREAERQILMNANDSIHDCGMFMVRESQTDESSFVLSVLAVINQEYSNNLNGSDTNLVVKHYKINQDETSGSYYIFPTNSFLSIITMIEYYSQKGNAPVTSFPTLTKSCPATASSKGGMGVWEIDRATLFYSTDDRLGGGLFGDVYLGTWKTGSECIGVPEALTKIAVKVLKNTQAVNHEDFLKEATVMRSLRHSNLVALHGVVSIEYPMIIVLEYMENGSLVKYLRKHIKENNLTPDNYPLTNPNLIHVIHQISSACCYMEQLGFIHRDIRAGNVLVGSSLKHCKLADFGLSRSVKTNSGDILGGVYEPSSKSKFPVRWTAPEATIYHQYSLKSDVWSFGIFMYEVATCGKIPYAGMTNSEVLEEVPKGHRINLQPLQMEKQFSLEFIHIMQSCWEIETADRPTFQEIDSTLQMLK